VLSVLGDQIYLAALIELAGKTPVGNTWILDRSKILLDLGIADRDFEELQRQIEARIPGKWENASSTSHEMYVYIRMA
jgi:hypothetical protein